MSFELDIAAWCDKAEAALETSARAIVLGVAESLVFKTPVGKPSLWKRQPPPGYVPGTLRAGWHYSSGPASVALPARPDAGGRATLAAIAAALPDRIGGKVHYLINNVAYGPVIEYLGYSRQAPQGMVGLTVLEFESMANQKVLEVAR